ncbi:MAG: hypothetical protein IJQ73_16410 [Kiritimatiellae bacterium]|nr:hypothetical protein [Kiritimatiellia bacterium]
MARSRKKNDYLSGPVDIAGQLWHYDGENRYQEVEAGDRGFLGGLFRRGGRSRAERDRDKFTHYVSAGGVKYEDRSAKDQERPYLQKARVVRWLVILAAVWTVFRFVSL